jgi:hypothetical protein
VEQNAQQHLHLDPELTHTHHTTHTDTYIATPIQQPTPTEPTNANTHDYRKHHTAYTGYTHTPPLPPKNL